jgi:hypothetical protein
MENGGYQKHRSHSCLPARSMYVMPARSGSRPPSLVLVETCRCWLWPLELPYPPQGVRDTKTESDMSAFPTEIIFYWLGRGFLSLLKWSATGLPPKLTSKVDLRFAFSNEVNMSIRLSLTFLSDIVAPLELFAICAARVVELTRSPPA